MNKNILENTPSIQIINIEALESDLTKSIFMTMENTIEQLIALDKPFLEGMNYKVGIQRIDDDYLLFTFRAIWISAGMYTLLHYSGYEHLKKGEEKWCEFRAEMFRQYKEKKGG
ncbi:hypothetical protein DG37_14520 [Listeria monocytogenes]|nr:hypothetical protein [Listeria monocytogenes]